jgi:shikimate kinase
VTGHLILVGLPGAGKSTVGPEVARRLGCAFLDFDAEIERRERRSVAQIFAQFGEPAFRALERSLTHELRDAAPMVLAPGGGWVATPGNVELLRPPGIVVYLAVSPAKALERLGHEKALRPLLAGDDPSGALSALLERRKEFYLQANHTVSTESLGPSAVADCIVALAGAEPSH